jgi:NTP pyrophosphatase (non-canonical NTP hydrolase)
MNTQEIEALRILQEECAEVIQAISKVFRFGDDKSYPEGDPTNLRKLEEEVGDLMCMIEILTDSEYFNFQHLKQSAEKKKQKLRKWSKIYE